MSIPMKPDDPAYFLLEQGLNASLPSSPPLRDIIIALSQKTKQLNALDGGISDSIRTLEDHFRAAGVDADRAHRAPQAQPRLQESADHCAQHGR